MTLCMTKTASASKTACLSSEKRLGPIKTSASPFMRCGPIFCTTTPPLHLVSLFGKKTPDLYSALAEFYNNVYELSTVYEWQEAVLPIAIKAHTFIVAQQPTDPAKWVISEKFQGRFYTAKTMIEMGLIMGAGVKRRRLRSSMSTCRSKSSRSNNPSISYELFNNGGCRLVAM